MHPRRSQPVRSPAPWTPTILLFLLQDGVTNGAIYALLALALVLVFAVTRVILVPQGEFVAYGALTLAMFDPRQGAGHRRAAPSSSRPWP